MLGLNFRRLYAALRPGRLYISGTGRAGTTFLMQLFTELGLDTGFKRVSDNKSYFPTARAGLEQDLFDRKGPRIVKSPFLCDHVDDVLAAGFKIGTRSYSHSASGPSPVLLV